MTAAPSDDVVALEEQRDFLLRSLEDLERERAAGDLADDDYATLRDDYTVRAAEALRALEAARGEAAPAAAPVRRRRRVAVFAGVVAFAVVAGLVAAASLGARQAGDSATGGISTRQTPSQQAQACIPKLQTEGPGKAIPCLQAVLDDDPRNVVALTWLAWSIDLAVEAGGLSPEQTQQLQDSSSALIDRAVEVNPDYSYARAFRAILAFRHGDPALAKQYLAEFEANSPSPDARGVMEQMKLAERIDAALSGDPSTTTTPGATATTTTSPPG
ncbi:MAG: hypothetical protein R2746_13405 [Acidimicrobiales bacterium]|nr:hypothetical protein [Actinomycetota bacterium]